MIFVIDSVEGCNIEKLVSNIKNNTVCVEIVGLIYVELLLSIAFSIWDGTL